MRRFATLGLLLVMLGTLPGCIVINRPAPAPAGAVWVPGHYAANGAWVPGHWR